MTRTTPRPPFPSGHIQHPADWVLMVIGSCHFSVGMMIAPLSEVISLDGALRMQSGSKADSLSTWTH